MTAEFIPSFQIRFY